ncbi:MAG: hypothetical protein ACO3C1_05970 [Ilumatobacteraceae bacterium]
MEPTSTPTSTATPMVEGTAGSMSSDRCHRFGTYADCPMCGGALHAEHAHFRCGGCGWRDSCCD